MIDCWVTTVTSYGLFQKTSCKERDFMDDYEGDSKLVRGTFAIQSSHLF